MMSVKCPVALALGLIMDDGSCCAEREKGEGLRAAEGAVHMNCVYPSEFSGEAGGVCRTGKCVSFVEMSCVGLRSELAQFRSASLIFLRFSHSVGEHSLQRLVNS